MILTVRVVECTRVNTDNNKYMYLQSQ